MQYLRSTADMAPVQSCQFLLRDLERMRSSVIMYEDNVGDNYFCYYCLAWFSGPRWKVSTIIINFSQCRFLPLRLLNIGLQGQTIFVTSSVTFSHLYVRNVICEFRVQNNTEIFNLDWHFLEPKINRALEVREFPSPSKQNYLYFFGGYVVILQIMNLYASFSLTYFCGIS